MITSKQEFREYLLADKLALRRDRKIPRLNDLIWKYEIALRKCEYYNNCRKDILGKLWGGLHRYFRFKLGIKCGFSIPINTCGKGLCIEHMGPGVISEKATLGNNCKIHVGVNIGADARQRNAYPHIGNNVYIGPGAKIFGDITIADNIAIGANAVVNKSFL